MRGQVLFTRPIEPADHDALASFLESHSAGTPVPETGLIGKLVGNLVALAGTQITPDSVRLTHIVVKPDLRRKQVARLMLNDLEQLAANIGRRWIVVSSSPGTEEFLRRVGFEREGVEWIREVRRSKEQLPPS